MYEENLSAEQRNYRKPGRRLLPRDAYNAHESRHFKVNAAGLRKMRAIEAAAMGSDPREPDYFTKSLRLYNGLSSRVRRMLVRNMVAFGVYQTMIQFEGRPNWFRYLNAVHTAEMARIADDRMGWGM